MGLIYQDDLVTIFHGDCCEILPSLKGISAVVTDPPYELGFMGKKWDGTGISFQPETWRLIREACLPGAMLLSFGGTRTSHRIACAIEDAGWQIRDTICWVYGSGFPKSLDISKAIDKKAGVRRGIITKHIQSKINPEIHAGASAHITMPNQWDISEPATPEAKLWEGYGTALKPAYEPIIVAMNPLDGTFADNALKHKVAGLNIDACRIPLDIENEPNIRDAQSHKGHGHNFGDTSGNNLRSGEFLPDMGFHNSKGRFPANLILDGSQEVMELFPENTGGHKTGRDNVAKNNQRAGQGVTYPYMRRRPFDYNDFGGSAARFFYCAKSSHSERNIGLDNNITVKYNVSNGGALCKDEIMVAVQLLPKVISGSTAHWSKDEFGEGITAQFHRDISSTILTETNKIIELKTLPLLMHSLTNEYTQDADGLMADGGNLAESVGSLREYLLTITNGNRELARGASRVVLEMLLKISVKENWHENYNSHVAVKPLALMTYLCKLVKMPEYNLILDPFCGSGTTLLACRKLGVKAIGIDSNEEYCKIAAKRCANRK